MIAEIEIIQRCDFILLFVVWSARLHIRGLSPAVKLWLRASFRAEMNDAFAKFDSALFI